MSKRRLDNLLGASAFAATVALIYGVCKLALWVFNHWLTKK